MTLLRAATFESGTLTGTDAFTSVTIIGPATHSANAADPILGGFSYRIVQSGSAQAFGTITFTSTVTFHTAFYFRFDTLPAGAVSIFGHSGGNQIRLLPDGTLRLYRSFALTGTASPALVPGTIYRVEMSNVSGGSVTLALAEGDDPSTVFVTAAAIAGTGSIQYGTITSVNNTITLDFDEIHADNATMPVLPPFASPGIELAARLEFGLDIRPDIEVTRTLVARLEFGLDTRADIHIARGKELAARLVFAADMRPAIQVERQLAARLEFGIDQRLDIQVGAPGQQLAARLVFGLGIQPDTLQVTRTLSARLVFGLDTSAALLITRQLAARLVMGFDLREGYTGPGTGLVVAGVRDPLSTLREGDTFNIFLPWGGLQGTSGLAHVLSRRVSDDRDEQELELSIVPNDAANVPQLATGATPTPTADGTDVARKQARQAREIDKLERTRRG